MAQQTREQIMEETLSLILFRINEVNYETASKLDFGIAINHIRSLIQESHIDIQA